MFIITYYNDIACFADVPNSLFFVIIIIRKPEPDTFIHFVLVSYFFDSIIIKTKKIDVFGMK